jgi:hypothetical protein
VSSGPFPRPAGGSYRDPDNRVYLAGDRVLRRLGPRGAEDWTAFRDSGVADRLIAEGRLVATADVPPSEWPQPAFADATAVLAHEPVPFVSYAYEWPWEMLRDAALLHLDVLEAALGAGLILKDGSASNVQWHGSRPVFIDVGSFALHREGEPWVGYRQFCRELLYPLLLTSFRGVPFQPWLRGSLSGIGAADMAALLPSRTRLRPSLLAHVHLHRRMEERYADRRTDTRREIKEAGFNRNMIVANVRGLRKLIGGLKPGPSTSNWEHYGDENSYSAADEAAKARFVAMAAAGRRRRLAWDMGANDGRYSRLLADHADYVVAFDSDTAVVARHYRELNAAGRGDVLPLVMDLTDPSPAGGWRSRERQPPLGRGRPELVLWLAVLHHLSIAAGIPVNEWVAWAADMGASIVVEWVEPEDPMARKLLDAKAGERHADYDRAAFELALGDAFEIERVETLPSRRRVLYLAHPRGVPTLRTA